MVLDPRTNKAPSANTPSGQVCDISTAKRIFSSIDSAWVVCPTSDGAVILDGDDFTAEQLEAIAYLLRHEPDALIENGLRKAG